MSGWIKVFRSVIGKGWYKNSDFVHLWVHLILKANHEPNEWLYKGENNHVERGQFITSRKTLSEETGINESKIERILKCFEIEQQIEQQNLFTKRLISILNYENYQSSEQQSEQQVNSKRTASEQQVNTNKSLRTKECKKEYTPVQVERFEKFDTWLTEKADRVKGMKVPFNPKSYESCVSFFVKEFNGNEKLAKETMSELLINMHNRADLHKKNRDANLTIRNWYKMGKERKNGNTFNKPAEVERQIKYI